MGNRVSVESCSMGKGGRPKVRLSHLGMTKLYMWIARYMKIKFIDDKKNKTTRIKSETTSWNAYKKLTNIRFWVYDQF